MRRRFAITCVGFVVACAVRPPATAPPRVVDVAPAPSTSAEGDELHAGVGLSTTGTVLNDGTTVEIVAPLSVEHALQLRVGAPVRFHPASVTNTSWMGRLATIERATIRITVPNADLRLKRGMSGPVFVDLSVQPPPAPDDPAE